MTSSDSPPALRCAAVKVVGKVITWSRAVEILGQRRFNSTVHYLADKFSDTDANVRKAAVGIVGELRLEKFKPEFNKLLNDTDDGVRGAAGSAIARFKSMNQPLSQFLFDVDDNAALARSTDPPAFMPFHTTSDSTKVETLERDVEDNCADVTVHVMEHWEVLHPLDFIGSVVDLFDQTKSIDQVRFYGFARPMTHSNESDFLSTGVYWEGYSDAQSYLSHLGGGAQEPIAEVRKVRKRVVRGYHSKHQLIHSHTNTQNETNETKDAAAAAIEKVEVIGQSAQLAELKEK